jgi:hypothetical protein
MPRRIRITAAALRRLAALCSCAFIVAGCSGGADGVTVSGTVNYRGQPFSNASITFYPASGRPVSAAISDGEYSLRLQPGEYQVTVSLGVNLPPGWKEGDPIPPREFVLPQQYSSVLHTQLTATVSEDQSAPLDFKLE